MSVSALSFTIAPATVADIPEIDALSEAAMASDRQTQFKKAAKDPSVADDGTKAPFADYMANPKIHVLKATETGTGMILGYVCWAFRGYEQSVAAKPIVETKPPGNESKKSDIVRSSETPKKNVKDPVDRLNEFESADFSSWMSKIMPEGTKCMFICGISVHPQAQGRGVGKALIRWGTEQVDKDGVFCWVHASEAGYPVFRSQGFEVDRTLDVDLDKYAKDVEREDVRAKPWGIYRLRYMVRTAVI